jgi:hypothetical protein
MQSKTLLTSRQIANGLIILVFIYSLFLIYQHFNGGVPSHHFMANKAYPEISNWYGLLIISLLSYTTYAYFNKNEFSKNSLLESVAAFLYGLTIFFCFNSDYSAVTKIMFLGLFFIGLLYPIYRIHIYFGIVLGMTYGFGAILPAIMIGFAALLSFAFHFFRQLVVARFFNKVR